MSNDTFLFIGEKFAETVKGGRLADRRRRSRRPPLGIPSTSVSCRQTTDPSTRPSDLPMNFRRPTDELPMSKRSLTKFADVSELDVRHYSIKYEEREKPTFIGSYKMEYKC